jgi:hypothetical protein
LGLQAISAEFQGGQVLRIGILTHHWVANFGANLQALATKLALEKSGAQVVFLNFFEPGWERRIRDKVECAQMQRHDEFVARRLLCSRPLSSVAELEEYCEEELDIVVVGSDAMFQVDSPTDPFIIARALRKRQRLPRARLPAFWLPWERKNAKRATLSVSAMGTAYHFIRGRLRAKMKASLKRFDFIAVRDSWTQGMIQSLLSRSPEVFPDPVFSLRQHLKDLPAPKVDVSSTVLLSGPMDSRWLRALSEVLREKGYTVAGIRIPETRYEYDFTDFNINEPLDPLEWFSIISGCAGYVGIRFHALVSCMVNSRPVINVDPHKKSSLIRSSSKMWDMCERAGTPERFFTLNSLRASNPQRVADLLFDKSLREKSDTYCEYAYGDFQRQIDAILSLCA